MVDKFLKYIIFQRLSSSTITRIIRPTFVIIFDRISKFSSSYDYSLDGWGRCRWSSNPDEPLLFVKYDHRRLNILDTEKKAFVLKGPVEIESIGKRSRAFLFFFFQWEKRINLLI